MANEFIARKGIVVSGASQQALRTVGNGNILIGSGSTDSGYTLQTIGSVLFVGSGTSSSTSLSVRNIAGNIRLNVQNDGVVLVGTGLSAGLGAIIRDSVYNTGLGIHGNDEIRLYSNNAIPFYTKYAGGGTPIKLAPYIKGLIISTDATNADSMSDPSAAFQVTGSRTASSSIALGVFFNNTLTAAANGDTLIGLDVRPTFSVGSYSGYTLLSLRSSGDTLFTTTGGTNTLRTFRTGNVLVGSGSTDLGSTLSVIGSSLMSGNTSGSTLLNVVGSQGQLFSVVDTLTGSLMSVNDISGLPILEVFSDDRVVMGEYATNALVVSGRSTGFGVTPSDANYRIISSGSTLFSGGTMIVKGSGTTSGSTAFVVQNSSGGTLLNLFNNGNLNIDNGALYVNGDTGNVGIGLTPIYKLDVNGAVRFQSIGTTSVTHSFLFRNDNSSYGGFTIGSSGQSLSIQQASGYGYLTAAGFFIGSTNSNIWTNNGSVLDIKDVAGTTTYLRVASTTGNLLINTTTDAGYKLDVNGSLRTVGDTYLATSSGTTSVGAISQAAKFYVRGSGNTSTSIALRVQNSSSSDTFYVSDDGTTWMFGGGRTFKFGAYSGTEFLNITDASSRQYMSMNQGNTITTIGGNVGYLKTRSSTSLGASSGIDMATVDGAIIFYLSQGNASGYHSDGVIIDKGYFSSAGSGVANIFRITTSQPYANASGPGPVIGMNVDLNPITSGSLPADVRAIQASYGNVYLNTHTGSTIIGYSSGYTSNKYYKLQVSGTSLFTGTLTNLSGGSSGQLFSMDLSQSAVTGNTIYAINVSPTLRNTASGQTQVALRVMPTFTGSSTGTSTTNKIVDFGSQNVGTQFTVTDATTGDIYMVNDVSGLPIIAANSSWDVSMYNYPNTVFKKTNNSILLGVQNNTGSTVSIYGDLVINEGYGFTNTTTQVSGTTSTGATSAVTIYTLTTSTNKSYSVSCLTTGYGISTRNTTSGKVEGTFKNSGGTLSMVGTTIQYVSADIVSTNVDFELSGSSIVLRVTGTTTENYTWGSTITSQVI
jgi:hypothetical protein